MTATATATEVRVYTEGVQMRAETDEKQLVLRGLLIPYNTPATVVTKTAKFVEEVAERCFAKSISESALRLPLMARHDSGNSWPIGSAVEWDDRTDGLWGQWLMAGTFEARTAWQLVDERHLGAMSAGFLPIRSDWTLADPPDLDHVVRREARLLESSLVSVGVYKDAHVLTRSAEGRVQGTPHLDSWRKWYDAVKTPAY